jgi:predicted HTH domain antitoxin
MTEIISTRLKKEELAELNRISEKEHVDRSALVRKFLIRQVQEYNMRDMAERYRKGLVSLAEAATIAGVSIYEMMDFLDREKISPPQTTEDEFKESMDDARDAMKRVRPGNK